jgi:hypothetical protein
MSMSTLPLERFVDEGRQSHTGRLLIQMEVEQSSLHIEARRRRNKPKQCGVTAPSPVLGPNDDPRADWVHCDVPVRLEGMPSALDQNGVETLAKEMTSLAPTPVRPLCVAAVQVLRAGREIAGRRVDEKVIVRREKAVGTARPVAKRDDLGYQVEKLSALAVVFEEGTSQAAVCRDVKEAVRDLNPVGARHRKARYGRSHEAQR